jgi:hypothetical protein
VIGKTERTIHKEIYMAFIETRSKVEGEAGEIAEIKKLVKLRPA